MDANYKHAFCELMCHHASTPVLVFPDFSRSFILDLGIDATATGLGTVLSQVGVVEGWTLLLLKVTCRLNQKNSIV